MIITDVHSIETILTVFGSVASSSGFLIWLQKKSEKKDAGREMLLGLAHDRLVYLALQYISKKEISKEEFENLNKYLYVPYQKMGGNGTVERLMKEIERLPITSSIYHVKEEEESF